MSIALLQDLLNSRKILFHFAPIMHEYLGGKRTFSPIAVEIHPTSKCNHRCIHCSYMERNEKRVSLDAEVMEDLVNSIIRMGVKAVYFSGGGEPTVYKGITNHIEKLYNNSVECALLTNGSYLEESGIIDIAYMLNYIAISVPSVNLTSFKKITGVDSLEKVLVTAKKIKEVHKAQSPIIGARIVITNMIYKESLEILKEIEERQFDYALFKIVRDYEGNGLGLNQEEEMYLRNLIDNIAYVDESFTNIKRIFDYQTPQFNGNTCIVNEMGFIANVDSDGKVYPNIVEIGKENFCIGDLKIEALECMWNNKKHRQVKRCSTQKWLNQECENCRAIAYNNILADLIMSLPSAKDCFI